MKRLICAAACAICATACHNAAEPGTMTSDMRAYGLVHPVRSVSVDGSVDELPYTARFDRNGRLSTVICRTAEGRLRDKTVYKYSREGKLIEKIVSDADGQIEGRTIYEWDGDCLESLKFHDINNEVISRIENENIGGRTVSSTFYSEGEFDGYSLSDYGENCCDKVNYDADSTEIARIHYEYTAGDRPVRIYSADADLDIRIEYDENLLPVHSYDALLDSDGELNYNMSMINEPERWYSYTFDGHGNWIERREMKSEGGETVTVLRRKIRY